MSDDSKFQNDVLNEINRFRTQPNSCSNDLLKYEEKMKQEAPHNKSLLADISKVTSKLSGRNSGCSGLKLNKVLCDIANELVTALHNTKGKKFYAQDQDYLETILAFDFEDIKVCRNYLSTEEKPRNIVIDAIFSQADIEEGTHYIIHSDIKFAGIARDTIRGKQVTVIVISDSVNPVKPQPLKNALISELNKLRENPRAYIKYIPEGKQKSEVAEFLEGRRRVGKLIENDSLSLAAQGRGEEYDTYENKKNFEQLVDFLEKFGAKYCDVGEYIGEKTENAKDFVIDLLTSSDETVKEKILNRRYNQVGYSITKESNKVVLLFADSFEGTEEQLPETLSFRRRLHRPNFTEDEVKQLQNDFNNFDISKTGLIRPNTLLLFIEKDPEFKEKNPFYYLAIKNLNTEENNANGVGCDEFIAGVKKAIKEFNTNIENWREVYKLYFDPYSRERKVLDKDVLKRILEELGYNVMGDEVGVVIEKLEGEEGLIDEDKFVSIMTNIEYRFALIKTNRTIKTVKSVRTKQFKAFRNDKIE